MIDWGGMQLFSLSDMVIELYRRSLPFVLVLAALSAATVFLRARMSVCVLVFLHVACVAGALVVTEMRGNFDVTVLIVAMYALVMWAGIMVGAGVRGIFRI